MERFEKKPETDEVINDGAGVLVHKKILYHGSGTSGIKEFNKAEEDTVGSGLYFTSKPEDASGYAKRRARNKEGSMPVLYESEITETKLLDLRKKEIAIKTLTDFKHILAEKLKQQNITWVLESTLLNAIDNINSGKINAGNIREATFGTGKLFSEYISSLGYDGLIALEGGEGEDIGEHDTYLIFEPKKARLLQETNIKE